MDIHEECVRTPAPHFAYLDVTAFVEVHGHGTTSPERMTADVTLVISQVEEAVGFGSFLECLVDVIGIYIAFMAGSQEVRVDE